MHRLRWQTTVHRKTSVHRLRTNEISKLVLFLKLTGGPFLQRQYFAMCRVSCFVFLKRTSVFQTASVGVC